MIYVVAPTYQRGTYWCQHWGYGRREVQIITISNIYKLLGLSRDTPLIILDYSLILDAASNNDLDMIITAVHRFDPDALTFINDTRQDYPR